MFNGLKFAFREHDAQRMLIKEATKQLPSNFSKNTIEKRIKKVRKNYNLFSNIGYNNCSLK